jgi:hypothetical protein
MMKGSPFASAEPTLGDPTTAQHQVLEAKVVVGSSRVLT